MKLNPDCREVTQLVLQGLDRKLSPAERLAVRMHMLICKACPRFERQVALMQRAMGAWRRYNENEDGPPPPV